LGVAGEVFLDESAEHLAGGQTLAVSGRFQNGSVAPRQKKGYLNNFALQR
jgi:hypothetical protein